jgi:hypothetical protein
MNIDPEIASKKFVILLVGTPRFIQRLAREKFASQCAVVYRSVKCEPKKPAPAVSAKSAVAASVLATPGSAAKAGGTRQRRPQGGGYRSAAD